MTKPMWKVSAAKGGRLIEDFKKKNIVAIGWKALGNLEGVTDRNKIIRMVQEKWPENSEKQALTAGSQIYRFRCEIKKGDRIVSYDPSRRVYLIGSVLGDYEFNPDLIPELPHYRTVQWDGEIDRDNLSVPTKNTLGAIMALFRLSEEAATEIEAVISGQSASTPKIEVELKEEKDLLKEMQDKSHEFIKDRINKLDWDGMQELVAGLLRAMGYKTRISPAGADRGKDIVASPDGFGLEQPRIIVEVKHRDETVGAQQIRSFIGGRHKDDKGLYVSTGGFTKEARYEAERAGIPLMLMDSDDLVTAIVENYEKLDVEAKGLLHLTKIYWPA